MWRMGSHKSGFDAEWRDVHVLAVEGDMFSRSELFDEADLDAAIARFDQLSRPATRLENAASRANERTHAYFAARDWDAIAEIVADDISTDDRRRVVNAGLLHGRDATIESFRWAADLGVAHATSDPIATRGERLVLTRTRYSHSDDQPQPFDVDLLHIVEINADERIGAVVIFDLEDFAGRHRRTRQPLPRRRSGRPLTHMVGHHAGLRLAQPARTSLDDTRLGEHRPPARDINRARWNS